jgi:hypothetical protein
LSKWNAGSARIAMQQSELEMLANGPSNCANPENGPSVSAGNKWHVVAPSSARQPGGPSVRILHRVIGLQAVRKHAASNGRVPHESSVARPGHNAGSQTNAARKTQSAREVDPSVENSARRCLNHARIAALRRMVSATTGEGTARTTEGQANNGLRLSG